MRRPVLKVTTRLLHLQTERDLSHPEAAAGNLAMKDEQVQAEVEGSLIKAMEWTKARTAQFEGPREIETTPDTSRPMNPIPTQPGQGNVSLLSLKALEALPQMWMTKWEISFKNKTQIERSRKR